MQKYTLGFIFDSGLNKVLLMHKLSPAWQNGKINGVGGKTESDEDSLTCIVREIREETSLETLKEKWILVGNMRSATWSTDVFGYMHEGKVEEAKSMEAQKIEWFDVRALPSNVISNLTWLIPLTIDKLQNQDLKMFDVEYEAK